MKSPWPPVIMLIVLIACLVGFMVTSISNRGAPSRYSQNTTKVIKCSNSEFEIGMMIDSGTEEFYVSGKKVDPENIEAFNQMAVRARWPHSEGYTYIYLDRVNGKAELTDYDFQDVPRKKDQLNCRIQGAEF